MSEVHQVKGELALAEQKFDEAVADFDKAIKLDAGNPIPFVDKARGSARAEFSFGWSPGAPLARKRHSRASSRRTHDRTERDHPSSPLAQRANTPSRARVAQTHEAHRRRNC